MFLFVVWYIIKSFHIVLLCSFLFNFIISPFSFPHFFFFICIISRFEIYHYDSIMFTLLLRFSFSRIHLSRVLSVCPFPALLSILKSVFVCVCFLPLSASLHTPMTDDTQPIARSPRSFFFLFAHQCLFPSEFTQHCFFLSVSAYTFIIDYYYYAYY